ncbi:MAG: hypothetical protein GQ574_10980 [Crocinitomix sp.]|nr:hypothetical protein [Crocinitomix sp.]
MKKYILLLLIITLRSVSSFADEAPHKMEELLLRTDLVVHIELTGTYTDTNFRARVLDVLHNNHTGIKTGDYLKIANNFDDVCPASFPREYAKEKREALAFMSYWEGHWYLTLGEIGFIYKNKARIQFYQEGCEYIGTIAEWKLDLANYYEHFWLDKKGEIKAKYTRKSIEGKAYCNLVKIQYESIYHGVNFPKDRNSNLEVILEELLEMPEPLEVNNREDEEAIITIVEIQPIPRDTAIFIMNDIVVYIRENYPEINDLDIEGITYYSLLFEKDGTISEVKMLRSIHPKIDEGIKAYYQIHNQWTPPQVYKGKTVRHKGNFFLKFGM